MALTRPFQPNDHSDSSDTDEYFDAISENEEENGADSSKVLDILYEVHWSYSKDRGTYDCEEDPCPATEIYKLPREKPRCVISIIAQAIGVSTEEKNIPRFPSHYPAFPPRVQMVQKPGWRKSTSHRPMPIRPTSTFVDLSQQNQTKKYPGDDFKTTSIYAHGINIHSPHLLKALRDLVKYYPSQHLGGGIISVFKPYAMLLHYYHDLKNLRDMHAGNGIKDPQDEEIVHHLTVLVD
ncbi:hypothetical protein F4805DRAFT_427446 [Annulohypoxylon moriforme]|nr:hypothetical protein F4805DRAFT_427446 [Annulohypoxylon moriforme]